MPSRSAQAFVTSIGAAGPHLAFITVKYRTREMPVPESLLGEAGWSRHAAFFDKRVGGHDYKHDKDKNRYENRVLEVKDWFARSWSFLLRLYDGVDEKALTERYGGGSELEIVLCIVAAILRRRLPDYWRGFYWPIESCYVLPSALVNHPIKVDILLDLVHEFYDASSKVDLWDESDTSPAYISALVPVVEQRYKLWVQAGMDEVRYAAPVAGEEADDELEDNESGDEYESEDEDESEVEQYAPDSPVAATPVSAAPVIKEVEEIPPAKRARYNAPVTSVPRPGSPGYTPSLFIRPASNNNLGDLVYFCPPKECLFVIGMIVGQPEWYEGRWVYRMEVKVPENTLVTKARLAL